MSQLDIRQCLFNMQDLKYRDFHAGLIPNIEKDRIIGVRTPQLRSLAKELYGSSEAERFMAKLPHDYYDEDQLHAFLICREKDLAVCLKETEKFLPYINNWATCDQLLPPVFKKNKEELLPYIEQWLQSDHTYTVRFGIGMLMQHFLDETFRPEYLQQVSEIRSEEYYINMEIAWYFATALAKQYESTIIILENRRLDRWTHNKTIQKARESRRITPQQKEYLKGLKY